MVNDAAAAFHQLTSNPADRMETSGAAEALPNQFMDWIMKKLGATPDGKSS